MSTKITKKISKNSTIAKPNSYPINAKNVSRYSMPFFVHAFENCELNVLDKCVSPSRSAKYPPIVANEFLLQRLREIGLGKKI